MERTFCSDVAAQAGEPLLGSAATCSELVLVSWPKGDWEAEAMETPGLPSTLNKWYADRKSGGARVALRLISRPGTSSDSLVAMGWPGGWRAEGMRPQNLVAGMEAAMEAAAAGHSAALVERPVLIVCTHGNHDACCALHGQRFAVRARKAAARLGLELDVWESTHIGGHRFAANAITLPWGHMHGRLGIEDADTLVEHAAAGRPWLERFRGNVFLEEPRQVAEGAALAWAADRGIDARVYVGAVREMGVPVSVGPHQLVVRLEERPWKTLKSCDEAVLGGLEVRRLVATAVEEE